LPPPAYESSKPLQLLANEGENKIDKKARNHVHHKKGIHLHPEAYEQKLRHQLQQRGPMASQKNKAAKINMWRRREQYKNKYGTIPAALSRLDDRLKTIFRYM
jgi:shikimate kinase